MLTAMLMVAAISEAAQVPQGPAVDGAPVAVRPLQTPADAVLAALADIQTVHSSHHKYLRYVWIQDADPQAAQLTSYAINLAASRTANLVPGEVVGGYLVRFDLAALAPKEADLKELVANWERLAINEPCFHVTAEALVKTAPYKASDGKTYSVKRQRVAAPAPHASPTQAVLLAGITGSNAAIVEWRWLLVRMLDTIDVGFGKGLYYEFAGIPRGKGDQTDQQALLASLGADEKQIADVLESDNRVALRKSLITGKPRRVDLFHGQGNRNGQGLIGITHDVQDGDVKAEFSVIRNLLESRDRAREVIAERSNGLHYFTLYDANGKLVDVVPDNVASDDKIPAPHTKRLRPSISCIRCHGPEDGWKTTGNDVKLLLDSGLDVFGDLSRGFSPESLRNTVDILAGRFTGDFKKPISRGRDDYNDAIFRVTGGLTAKAATGGTWETFNHYVYDDVTTREAVETLGHRVADADAPAKFKELVGRHPVDPVSGFAPEDPYVAFLAAGHAISRQEFVRIQPDLYMRSQIVKQQKEPSK